MIKWGNGLRMRYQSGVIRHTLYFDHEPSVEEIRAGAEKWSKEEHKRQFPEDDFGIGYNIFYDDPPTFQIELPDINTLTNVIDDLPKENGNYEVMFSNGKQGSAFFNKSNWEIWFTSGYPITDDLKVISWSKKINRK